MAEFKWPPTGTVSGIVIGPGSSTDNNVPRWDGTTGQNLQGSTVYIDDLGNVTGVTDLTMTGDLVANDITAVDISSSGEITAFEGSDRELPLSSTIFDLGSTGAITFAGFTITGGNTTFTVGAGTAQIFDHVTDEYFPLSWSAFTGQTPAVATGITYVYIDRTGALVKTSAAPTGNSRRDYVFLGRLGAISGTITGVTTNLITSTAVNADLFDLGESIQAFKVNPSDFSLTPNGANLSIDRASGTVFQLGINFTSDPNNPNVKLINAAIAPTMIRATSTSVTGSSAVIDPANYDVGGVVTPVGGVAGRSTIMRFYQFTGSSTNIIVQYGQAFYANLATAIQNITTESYVVNPNIPGNAILVGVLCVTRACTDLTNTAQARFFTSDRFGDIGSGASGASVSTLQNAYNNSTDPEITTDATRGAVTVKRGSAADTDNVLEVQNGAGSTTFAVAGNGDTTIGGDLTVNGTTVTLNVANLNVEDKNIRVNSGGTDASAVGAGLSVEGTAASTLANVLYDVALASKFKLGADAAESEVITAGHTQTMTNKTLTSPAITTPTGIVKGDVGLGNVDNTSDATKNSATATLTNKTLDAPVIDNSAVFNHETTPASPSAGQSKIYPKSDGFFYTLNSAGVEVQIGSGTGTSINILDNPSAISATTGWTAATNYTVTRDSSNSPLAGIVDTCFAISTTTASSETPTSGVYAATQLVPAALRSGTQVVSLYVNVPASADGVWRLSIYNASGTRYSLPSDVSGATTLPAGFVGNYSTAVDLDSSASLTISLTQTTRTNANTLYATNISIGPGTIGQVSPSFYLGTYTPTLISSGATNLGLNSGFNTLDIWREVDRLIIKGTIQKDAVALGGTTSNTLYLGLPTGLTAKVQVNDYKVGTYSRYVSSYEDTQDVVYTSSGIAFISPTTSNKRTAANFPASTYIYIDISVPIAEWAGSGLSTGPGSEPEYVYPTGTWDSSTTTSSSGTQGAQMGSLSSIRTKDVTWQHPIQNDDVFEVQASTDRINWTAINGSRLGASLLPVVPSLDTAGNFTAGAGWHHTSSTVTRVTFGPYASRATDESPANNWPSDAYMRVKKYRNGQLPFAKATATNSGLYKAGEAPGSVSGAAIATGYVGEVVSASLSNTSPVSSGTAFNAGALSVTAGVWMIYSKMSQGGAGTTRTRVSNSISTTSATHYTPSMVENDGTANGLVSIGTAVRLLNVSATTTVYSVQSVSYTGSAPGVLAADSQFFAVRIA